MCKEGALGSQLLNQAQRVFNRRVRGVRAMAKGIEKQNIQLAKLRHRVRRNLAEIGEVGGASEAVSVDLGLAVQQPYRQKVCSKQNQLAIQRAQLNPRQRRVVRIRIKNVVERFPDLPRGIRIGIEWNFFRAAKAERTHIFKTENVVG